MNRAEVAHIVRAAQAITKEREFVLIGSQAANLQIDKMPEAMQMSGELDIYPLRRPDLSDLIDGAIGEGSSFHETFGYYAHGIGPETAKLPLGWEGRAIRISSPGMDKAIAIAPEIHDICASKVIVGREKDREYVVAAVTTKLVDPSVLMARVESIESVDEKVRSIALSWVGTMFGKDGFHR